MKTGQESIMLLNAFVDKICENGVVYNLESKEGFALCGSNQFQTETNEPVAVFCFWNNKESAKECCVEDWANYRAVEIQLASFIEDWCVGIYNDSFLVGLDFNSKMVGLEIDPIDLILAITKKLKSLKIDLEFDQFKGVVDIENQIKKMFG